MSSTNNQASLQRLLAQRVLARRRLLHFTQATHPSYTAGWVHEDICRRLERFSRQVEERKSPRLMLLMPPRHGKLLSDDTMVYTREGWSTHGALKVGDEVMGISGWTKVIGVSPPGMTTHEVVTNAGTRIQCHLHHEWGMLEFAARDLGGSRRGYHYGVFETGDFVAYKKRRGDLHSSNHSRKAGGHPMRKFYFPSIEVENYDLTVRRLLGLARRPVQNGRLAVQDVLELAEPTPGRCIQVAADDGLYLVTRDFVPTHNSELASIRFPAWHLGQYPHHELINVGYNLELPMRFSRKVREVMRDRSYHAMFGGAQLDPDSQSVEAWNTTKGGGFTAAGVGGGITGKGAHILVIDDPIKNQEEADSILVRDKLWDWYQSTAYTRLAPGGGVLVIECMVGETLVMLADGTEKRLDQMRTGDHIATYENGQLTTTRVAGWKRSGRDSVLKITTKSGKVVRANGRHPFLATTLSGELKWIRARSLSTTNKIVTVKGSAESGQEYPALLRAATLPPSAADFAPSTTPERNGQTDTEHPQSTQKRSVRGILNTATGSRWKSLSDALSHRMDGALSAASRLKARLLRTGRTSSMSITATPLEPSEDYSVTTATSPSDILELSPSHLPLHNTSDFTLEEIVSIEPDGEEEVYDLQVDRTENFIANGAVSHNTFWNDDDLAGRLQAAMRADPAADQFEIIRYPALSEQWEYRDDTDPDTPGPIFRYGAEIDVANPPLGVSRNLTLLRPKDFCLHEERYPTDALKRIRANLQPRIWSALYQQNPVPDEGMYFKREYFRYHRAFPRHDGLRLYTAWDFAIGEKQQNDWTVGATILQDETDTLYVVDIFRMKGDSFQIVEAMLDVAQRWGSNPTTGYLIGAEDGQIWRAIEPLLKKRMTERRQYPPYEVLRPMTDKMARARPLQGRMQQARVIFPEEAPWRDQAEQELLRFPAGAHDDVVDALAWAVHLCMGKEPPRLAAPKPLPSWRDELALIGSIDTSHMAA